MLGMNGILSGTGSEYDFTTTTSTPEDSADWSEYFINPELIVAVVCFGASMILGIFMCWKKTQRGGVCYCIRKKQENATDDANETTENRIRTESPRDTESTNTPSASCGPRPSRQERIIYRILTARSITGDLPARGCRKVQRPSTGHIDLSGSLTERLQSDNTTPATLTEILNDIDSESDTRNGSYTNYVNTLNDGLQSGHLSCPPPYDSDFPPSYGDIFHLATAHNDIIEQVDSPPPSYCEVLVNPSYRGGFNV